MGRTDVKRPERTRTTRTRRSADGFVIVAIGLLVLFALIGIVSAGIFVAGKVAGGSSHHPAPASTRRSTGGTSAGGLVQARAQATAIVKAAQDASRSIVSGATKKARKQAASARRQAAGIVAAAHKQARQIAAAAQAARVQQPVQPVQVAPTPVPPAATSPGLASGVGTTNVPVLPTQPNGATSYVPTVTTAPSTGSTPNLGSLPASWLVVGYNASFGTGPGTAGSITVVNRGRKLFNGVATVRYAHGGSASAAFSGLAPGQSLVLPLNGSRYTGGGYQIVVNAH